MLGRGGGLPALMAAIAPMPIKQRTASHTVLITPSSRMVRVCELIVSVVLNQAPRRRPGQEAHNMVEEFHARINEGRSGYSAVSVAQIRGLPGESAFRSLSRREHVQPFNHRLLARSEVPRQTAPQ